MPASPSSADPHRGTHEVEVHRDVRIPTDNPDVTLSADLHLPIGAGPVPAVLTVWPYRKDIGMAEAALDWFARRGYGTVLVDARGTGSSDGARRPPFDPGEAEDAVAAIEWAARQPWCDGMVGMWGHSYGAMMALRAAACHPAPLRAIVSYQCVIDPERDLWHPGGVRGGLTLASWGALTLTQQLLPPLHQHNSPAEQRRWHQRLSGGEEPWIVDLVRHGPGDPVWRERVIDAAAITVPTLCAGGWRDLMCEGTVRAFEQIPAPKKLVMGPWTHTMPHESPVGAIDFFSLMLRWWERWLRGIDNGVMDEPAVTLYLQGANPGWRAYESWPPAKTEFVLTTRADATLAEAATADPVPVEAIGHYRSDATAGALSGSWWLGHPGIPLDQHDDDMRALSTTSEPLVADALLVGRPEVTVWLVPPLGKEVTPSRLVVRLADVDPDGRSTFITAGLAERVRHDDPIRIMLWPTAYRVAAGNRLRVVVSDADFPRLWPVATIAAASVARIELVASTMPDDDPSAAVRMAEIEATLPDGQPPALWGGRQWRVTRDLIADAIDVVVGEEGAAYTPNRDHLLELRQHIHAHVQKAAPDTAVIEATNTAVARMSTGETVEVTVAAYLTRSGLTVRADVNAGGETTYAQTWQF